MMDIEETTFDLFLRYGLFFGAIFQLVCIGAAIFGPEISEAHSKVRKNKNLCEKMFQTLKFRAIRRRSVKILVLNTVAQPTLATSILGSTIVEKWIRKREDEDSSDEQYSCIFEHQHSFFLKNPTFNLLTQFYCNIWGLFCVCLHLTTFNT
jgi:hypothetical protein